MLLIPFERFSIATKTSARELTARLSAAVAPRPPLGHARSELPLEGWVRGNDFAFVRLRHELAQTSGPLQMNSFVPEVRGRIVGTADGARMEGTMMLRPVVLILMLVWIAALLGGFIALIVGGLRSGRWQWSDLLGLAAMLLFGIALSLLTFSREVRKTRETLQRVVEPEYGTRAS